MPRFTWTSERVAQALGLPASGRSAVAYSGVSTDTRTLRPGELFVGLRGERFDGTEFVAAAREAGAPGAVVERQPDAVLEDFELFLVNDALEALGRLAKVRRRALDAEVVGITGTSGKTTTRELAAAAIGDEAYASPGNYNNLVGLPLSVLGAPEHSAVWLLEIASNQRGEVERLGRIAEPDIGVITSVSEGHLEGLGDIEGVLEEKLGLLPTLRGDGPAFVADEPKELAERARDTCRAVITVGLSAAADERPERWAVTVGGVEWAWRGTEFKLDGYGSHLVRNALFALAVARHLGVDPQAAARRLSEATLPPMRGEVRRLDGLTLIVDCYNANPSSFRAAIESLAALGAGRRRAVLAGTMLELGDRSKELHERVARWILEAGIELVAATGEFAAAFEQVGERAGKEFIVADQLEEVYRALASRLQGDETVLLKASRGMKFERAIAWFERDFGRSRRA